jgi:hypothetical protein
MKFSVDNNRQVIDELRKTARTSADLQKFDDFFIKNPVLDLGNAQQMEMASNSCEGKCKDIKVELPAITL